VKNKVDDVARAYDSWSHVYDSDGNPLVALDDEVTPRLYSAIRGCALDVGCGTGRHSAHLSRAGLDVTGIDASLGMLAKARAHVPSAKFREHSDLLALPFGAGQFDVVTCALVLEHVEDLMGPIKEMARVTKRGGLVIVSDIHARMREMTQANFTDPATGDDILPPSFPHEPAAYADAAVAAGLRVVSLRELEGTEDLAARVPRAKKYVGVRMLTVLVAEKPL
jgi:ubiquinone/menaquinone biosynthesis C-methylase UbiE